MLNTGKHETRKRKKNAPTKQIHLINAKFGPSGIHRVNVIPTGCESTAALVAGKGET